MVGAVEGETAQGGELGGHQVVKPISPQEKINAIRTLAKDDEVASKVTTDMLRCLRSASALVPGDRTGHRRLRPGLGYPRSG
ncbi:DUF6192 family protein [Streptomyces violascens]|uniref:DUF6192 family protein n=1 Tax=Streptomyces violascens TaxID=67381 RepID=UPI00368B020C